MAKKDLTPDARCQVIKLSRIGQILGICLSVLAFAMIFSVYFNQLRESTYPTFYEALINLISLGMLSTLITLYGFIHLKHNIFVVSNRQIVKVLLISLLTILNLNYIFHINSSRFNSLVFAFFIIIFFLTIGSLIKAKLKNNDLIINRIYLFLYLEIFFSITIGLIKIMSVQIAYVIFGLIGLCFYLVLAWFTFVFTIQMGGINSVNLERNLILVTGIGNMLLIAVLGSFSVGLALLPLIAVLIASALLVELPQS